MAIYHELAGRIRDRITSGEWPIGTRLPSISELQDEYGIRSLNTVRDAQQLLVEEGLLETRQGIGAFVVATEPLTSLDVPGELAGIRDRLTTILAAMGSQGRRHLSIDLDDPDEPHLHFVLTAALRDFANSLRSRVEDDPADSNNPGFLAWAETAERMHRRVEEIEPPLPPY